MLAVRTTGGSLRVVESRMIEVVTHGGCHEDQDVELRELLLKKGNTEFVDSAPGLDFELSWLRREDPPRVRGTSLAQERLSRFLMVHSSCDN